MPRSLALLVPLALAGLSWQLAVKGGASRESLLPVLRLAQEHGKQFERAAARVLPLDAEEERRLGARIAARLGAAAEDDPELTRLGRRLERTGLVPRFSGRFAYRRVADAGRFAFSVPGGFVFVSSGMLDALEGDPARISFVLGHELAHSELGHGADKLRYRAWLSALGPGATLVQLLRELAAMSYDQSSELEADALALRLLQAADLRAAAGIEALERLQGAPGEGGGHREPGELVAEVLTDYWRTHPGARERTDRLRGRL